MAGEVILTVCAVGCFIGVMEMGLLELRGFTTWLPRLFELICPYAKFVKTAVDKIKNIVQCTLS